MSAPPRFTYYLKATICKPFIDGNCRFGDQCFDLHESAGVFTCKMRKDRNLSIVPFTDQSRTYNQPQSYNQPQMQSYNQTPTYVQPQTQMQSYTQPPTYVQPPTQMQSYVQPPTYIQPQMQQTYVQPQIQKPDPMEAIMAKLQQMDQRQQQIEMQMKSQTNGGSRRVSIVSPDQFQEPTTTTSMVKTKIDDPSHKLMMELLKKQNMSS